MGGCISDPLVKKSMSNKPRPSRTPQNQTI